MPFIDHKPESEPRACQHPEHNPPGMIALPEGTHTWQCPACGETKTIRVVKPTLQAERQGVDHVIE